MTMLYEEELRAAGLLANNGAELKLGDFKLFWKAYPTFNPFHDNYPTSSWNGGWDNVGEEFVISVAEIYARMIDLTQRSKRITRIGQTFGSTNLRKNTSNTQGIRRSTNLRKNTSNTQGIRQTAPKPRNSTNQDTTSPSGASLRC